MIDPKITRLPVPHRKAHSGVPASPAGAMPRRGGHPCASLSLVLRAAPELAPEKVAADLLAQGSNARAAPVWHARRARFRALMAERRLSGPDRVRLERQWRAAVAAEGERQKLLRRSRAEELVRWFESGEFA